MEIIIWIVLGGLAGWIASVVMKTNDQQGLVGDILLGIFGALLGGFLMNFLGQPGVSGLNLYSILVAIVGSILLIGLKRVITQSH